MYLYFFFTTTIYIYCSTLPQTYDRRTRIKYVRHELEYLILKYLFNERSHTKLRNCPINNQSIKCIRCGSLKGYKYKMYVYFVFIIISNFYLFFRTEYSLIKIYRSML